MKNQLCTRLGQRLPYFIHSRNLSTGVEVDSIKSSKKLTLKDIPGPSPSFPILGTTWQYYRGGRYHAKDIEDICMDKYLRYGPIVKEETFWRYPIVHLFNPSDTEKIMRNQGVAPIRPISEFIKHYRQNNPDMYDRVGIANSCGKEWLDHRNLVAPSFLAMDSLDQVIEGIDKIGDDFVDLMRRNRNPQSARLYDFEKFAELLSLEGIFLVTLNYRLGCLNSSFKTEESAAMISAVHLYFQAMQELYYTIPLWKYYETKSYKKLAHSEREMYRVASKRIKEAIDAKRNNNFNNDTKNKSILEHLLETKNITEKTIIVTIMDLIAGGVHTVTGSLTFLLDDIARNPEVQENIYKELKEIVPDGKITIERFNALKYLKACIKESFRLSPTIPFIARILSDEVEVSGYHIEPGTLFLCNFLVPCQQQKYFPEPEKFKPERWLEKRNNRPHPFTFLPFGFGTRMCVGRRISEMEMYIILAKLIYNFKIEPVGEKLKSKMAFIITPDDKLNVVLRERN